MNKGFTLIELLVVVGILAVLAVSALIAINPLEAQRRSRDAARLQDMARLSSAIEAFINDFGVGTDPAVDANAEGILSTVLLESSDPTLAGQGVRAQGCGRTDNWLGIDLCDYLKQVPVDPQNGRTISTVVDADNSDVREDQVAGYGFIYEDGDYEFCTRLEAAKSAELLNDSGTGDADSATFFETGSVVDLDCQPNDNN